MYNLDKYDILIEKITKEVNYMTDISKEKWEIPKYSGTQINKAGRVFIYPNSSQEERRSMDIINNWRAAHAYPLHVICSNLRNKNPNAIVVQRLKRLDSIIL